MAALPASNPSGGAAYCAPRLGDQLWPFTPGEGTATTCARTALTGSASSARTGDREWAARGAAKHASNSSWRGVAANLEFAGSQGSTDRDRFGPPTGRGKCRGPWQWGPWACSASRRPATAAYSPSGPRQGNLRGPWNPRLRRPPRRPRRRRLQPRPQPAQGPAAAGPGGVADLGGVRGGLGGRRWPLLRAWTWR